MSVSRLDPNQALEFVERTQVDCLAVAIGTAHGAYKKGVVPHLDIERLKAIKKAVNNLPLVLHGSSGTTKEELRFACQCGINKVNVAYDLCKIAQGTAYNQELNNQNAYFVYDVIHQSLKNKICELIELFGSKGKATDCILSGVLSTTRTSEEKEG